MNNGFYGFPSSNYGSSVISVTEFDSSGTYVIPKGAKRLWIMLIGAGGGGGGGARYASGTAASGGSGGTGGNINMAYYFVDAMGFSLDSNAAGNAGFTPGSADITLTITIGAGGSGGAGSTTNGTNGTAGTAGGASTVTRTGNNGFMMYSSPGGGGGAGNSTNVGAPTGQQILMFGIPAQNTYLTTGTAGRGSSGLPGDTQTIQLYTNTGGTGGGGTNGTSAFAGGPIVQTSTTTLAAINNPLYVRGSTIKAGGPAESSLNVATQNISIAGPYTPGMGGTGSGGCLAVNAGNGSDGWRGGGGGGGGGVRNGVNAGTGGAGGNGYCVIVALG